MKTVKVNRILLVKYTCISGEYEFSGHTTLTLKPLQKATAHVHEYFMDFYGEDNTDTEDVVRLEHYSYLSGQIAVKIDDWKEITPEQNKVLEDLGL